MRRGEDFFLLPIPSAKHTSLHPLPVAARPRRYISLPSLLPLFGLSVLFRLLIRTIRTIQTSCSDYQNYSDLFRMRQHASRCFVRKAYREAGSVARIHPPQRLLYSLCDSALTKPQRKPRHHPNACETRSRAGSTVIARLVLLTQRRREVKEAQR